MINQRNPAIKRIMADVKELQKHPSSRYHAAPLESDVFEWHFTIRGPEDTAFAGGIYHGRILLPAEYPFKPPNFVFLTKNGRFEVGTKICLSISAYHEESWQPAWGVRTMLEAIISFMPTEGVGAIGALDWSAEERKKLATESKKYCCSTCGPIANLLCEPSAVDASTDLPDPAISAQVAQLHMTRQHSDSERYRAGGLISDMSAASAVGIATSGGAELGVDALITHIDTSTAMSAIVTAEEDVSAHVTRVIEGFENDADNDCTLNQMINMELDNRCASPNSLLPVPKKEAATSAAQPEGHQDTGAQDHIQLFVGTNTDSSSSSTSVPSAKVATKPAAEPFTTETLAEIRKKRIAEKQQLLQSKQAVTSIGSPDVKHDSVEQVPVHVSEPGTPLPQSSSSSSSSTSAPSSSSSTTTAAAAATAAVSQQQDKQDVTSTPASSADSPQPPVRVAQAPLPAAAVPLPLPQAVVAPAPVVVQRHHPAVVVQEAPAAEPQQQQQQQQRDRQTFLRIHWILNALIVGTAGVMLGVMARVVVRSVEMSS